MSFTMTDVKKRIRLYIKPDVGSLIDDWIRAGQEYLEDELRIRPMMKLTTGTITDATNSIAVPSDYIEIISFSIVVNNVRTVLNKYSDTRLFLGCFTDKATTNEGQPSAFTRITDNFQFNCYTDQAYSYELYYWSKLTTLTLDTDYNWFVLNAINLLVFAALAEASPYLLSNNQVVDKFGRAVLLNNDINYWQNQRDLLLDRVKLRDIKEKIAFNKKGDWPKNVF